MNMGMQYLLGSENLDRPQILLYHLDNKNQLSNLLTTSR